MEFSSLLFGAGVGVVMTLIGHSVTDGWEAKAAASREITYKNACVKDYENGWMFDRCKRGANRQAAKAESELATCMAVFDKEDPTIAEIDTACPDTEESTVQ